MIRLFRRMIVHLLKPQQHSLVVNNYSLDFEMASANLRMSGVSKYIMCNLDLENIIRKRRCNYLWLIERLTQIPGIFPLFPTLKGGICPWVLPVVVPSQQEFHLLLQSKGIPAVTWGGVTHRELPLSEFPDAAFLYQHLVFLPVHQDLGEEELQMIVDEVKWASTYDRGLRTSLT